jgi:hypothetical protein
MNQSPQIRAIHERLRAGGYQDLPTPFRVAGVGFDFTAAMRGKDGRALDLILLIDTTTGDFGDRDAARVRQRVEALSRALDITGSRFVITVILAGAPLLGNIDALTETCRVLYVEGLAIDAAGKPVDERARNLLEDRIRLLLPLDLPHPVALEGGSGPAVEQLLRSLTADVVNQELLTSLIEASKDGESAVTAVVAKEIGKALSSEEQP